MIKQITFEILEPLIFKSSSEFAPSVSGPHARAESVPLPYPSTAAGTMSTLILESMSERILPQGNWSEQMSGLIGESAKLRGPYILSGTSDIFVQCNSSILKVEEALEYAKKRLNEDDDRAEENNFLRSMDVAGVKLSREKANEEGLLYFAKMIDYSPRGERKAICFDLVGESENVERVSFPKIVKFGGEGRAVRVSTNLGSSKTLLSYAEENAEKARALYVTSPIVFKTGSSPEGSAQEELTKTLGGITHKQIMGKIDLLGMGFMTEKAQRKPIFGALFPGSVIELDEHCSVTKEICENGVGLFSNLGYGTVIPFSRLGE